MLIKTNKSLNIYLVLGGSATAGLLESTTWINNIYQPLLRIGHTVTLINTDSLLSEKGMVYGSEKSKHFLTEFIANDFKMQHKIQGFDVFFSYLWNSRINPELFDIIPHDVYKVNYTTNLHQFEIFAEISKKVNLSIYPSKEAGPKFDDLNVLSYWMPFAATPSFYAPQKVKKSYDVGMIGSVYGIRPYYVWRMLQNNIKLDVWGPNWKIENQITHRLKLIRDILRVAFGNGINRINPMDDYQRNIILSHLNKNYNNLHGSLSDNEYVDTISKLKIIVNISESRYHHSLSDSRVLRAPNLRDFEVTMCGGFLLTQHSDELAEMFTPGYEIETYSSELELISKIEYYLSNDSARKSIQERGFDRAKRDHTWEKRFEGFFDYLRKLI